MSKENHHSYISIRTRKITNEIKFYNKFIDDKCNEIVVSMIDNTFPLLQVLREEKVTYMAPILLKRHRCNLVTRRLMKSKDLFGGYCLVDCEVKVLDQIIIHSIRNLIEKSSKILSLLFTMLSKDQKKAGFGFVNEWGKTGGFIEYALLHEDDILCKYVIDQYKDWIRTFCLIDNNIKHNGTLKSVMDTETWREKFELGQMPIVLNPTHYTTKNFNKKETLVEILKMDEYIDRCYTFVNHIIDEVYDRLCNNAKES